MPILDRLRRIARANITHLLNQAETPESEVEARIQELESGAEEAKNALAKFAVAYKRLEKNVQDLHDACAEHQRQAEQALVGGDEALARRALAEKLKAVERVQMLTPGLDSRRETYDELKEALVEIHDQLNQSRTRLMDLRARRQAADAENALGRSLDRARGPEGQSFERLEDAVMQSEARVDVDREIRGSITPLESERAYRRQQVEEELALLKQKMATGA